MEVKEGSNLPMGVLGPSVLSSPGPRGTRKKSDSCPGSPEPNCAICLEKLQNRSVTDSCVHKFCFTCLLEWSRVKAECPLCKSKFSSIIHNIRSDNDFEEYTLPKVQEEEEASGREGSLHPDLPPPQGNRFMEELHMTLFGQGRFRFNLPSFPIHPQQHALPGGTITLGGHHWRRRRGAASHEFRKSIYERNLWVDPDSLADITGRFRECSPDWFRNNPATTHRLVPWLNRELSVLINNRDNVSYTLNSVLEWICEHDISSRTFGRRLKPILGRHTAHFSHEFYHYARSVYDLVGYDRNAVHIRRELDPESDGGDEVIFLDEVRSGGASGTLESVLDQNTPSTSGGETSSGRRRRHQLIVPVDSSNESENDENIEILDVLGPGRSAQQRSPPELVLLSTDEEERGRGLGTTTIIVSSSDESSSEGKNTLRQRRRHHPLNSSSSQEEVLSPRAKRKDSSSSRRKEEREEAAAASRASRRRKRKDDSKASKEEEEEDNSSSGRQTPHHPSSCQDDEESSLSGKSTSHKSSDKRRKRKRKRRRRSHKPSSSERGVRSSSSSDSSQTLPKKSIPSSSS
eukprot:TRINITY_DN5022_c0_g1_i1.p1 TRINITY_DN5022_c0_g1~~TRINITY_DN5022_c0_g1_i1.p1  ORF type:complete len:574 (-),score=185.50 TRINITY_DN5022_c0_g1_i1:386-2107(-)